MNTELENMTREQLLELAKKLKEQAKGIPGAGGGRGFGVVPFEKRGKTVITVDDSRLIHLRIKSILEPMGFDVVATAGDGAEGVKEVLKHKPALVLLDFQMPVMDGQQTAVEIRKHDTEVKILVLSGTLVSNVAIGLLKAGVSDILVKPIDVHKFRESLSSLGFSLADDE